MGKIEDIFYEGEFLTWVKKQEREGATEKEILDRIRNIADILGESDSMIKVLLGDRFKLGAQLKPEVHLGFLRGITEISEIEYFQWEERIEEIKASMVACNQLITLRNSQISAERQRIDPLLEQAAQKRDNAIAAANKQYEADVMNIKKYLDQLEEMTAESQNEYNSLSDHMKWLETTSDNLAAKINQYDLYIKQLSGEKAQIIIDASFTPKMLVEAGFNVIITTSEEIKINPYLKQVADIVFNPSSEAFPIWELPTKDRKKVARADAIAAITLANYHLGKSYKLLLGPQMKKELGKFFKEKKIPWSADF